MLKLVTGLVIFLGTHSIRIVAPAWRDRMVGRVGPLAWKAFYSIVALAGFVLIVKGYAAARTEPVVLYQPPFWMRHVTMLLMLPVFPLLLSAYLPGHIKAGVKHPMLAATKTWAFAHLLVNGMLADVLLFGGFLAWAVVDRISASRRPQVPVPVPAHAVRNDVIAVLVGLVLWVAFAFWAHPRLIGVAVIPA